MSLTKHLLRGATACAALGLVLSAVPAYAADGPRFVAPYPEALDYATGRTVMTVPLEPDFQATGSGTVTNMVVTYDLSDADPLATLSVVDGKDPNAHTCARNGSTVTCRIGDFQYQDDKAAYAWLPTLEFRPKVGGTGEGSITISVKADNAEGYTSTQQLTVIEPIHFAPGTIKPVSAEPGSTFTFPVGVGNKGPSTIYTPRLKVHLTAHPTSVPSNCVNGYSYSSGSNESMMICDFPVALAPGKSYKLSSRLSYKIDIEVLPESGSLYDYVKWVSGTDGPATEDPDIYDPVQGTGPALTIVGAHPNPPKTPLQSGEVEHGRGFFTILDTVPVNLVVKPVALPNTTGAADVLVSFRNDGPGAVPRSYGGRTQMWVTFPQGVEVTYYSRDDCWKPDDGKQHPGQYLCGTLDIPMMPGEVWTFHFQVNIVTVDRKRTGSLKVGYDESGNPQSRYDSDPRDSVAPIYFKR